MERPRKVWYQPGSTHQQKIPRLEVDLSRSIALPVTTDAEMAISGEQDNSDQEAVTDMIPVRGNSGTSRRVPLDNQIIQSQWTTCTVDFSTGQSTR
jgi:hypothetical protein